MAARCTVQDLGRKVLIFRSSKINFINIRLNALLKAIYPKPSTFQLTRAINKQ